MSKLNERALHKAAAKKSGLSNFGNGDYLTGLRVGLDAVAQRPPSAKLDTLFEMRAMHSLSGRLYAEHGWETHPQYRQTKIVAPLVITGMSRSGTSALHQLLANDEQFQWIPHWLAAAPAVRPPRNEWTHHSTFNTVSEAVDRDHHSDTALRAAHNVEAALPEECINMMSQSFVSMMFITTLPLPLYYRWMQQQDETASYRRYANILRLIGANTPETTPWLLKNPSHGSGIDALLKVFPDARIVVTHRDPVAAISSAASLTNIVSGDLWEPGEIGRLRTAIGLQNVTRLQAAAERNPSQFHHVDYREFLSAPMKVVAGIYLQYGLTMSSGAEVAMRAWSDKNPQGKFGNHRYSAEHLGLDPEIIRKQFADYIKRRDLN